MEKINTVSLLRFSLSRSDRFSHFTQFSFISPKRKQFDALINVYSRTTSLFSNGEFSFRTRVYCRIIAAGKAGEFHIFFRQWHYKCRPCTREYNDPIMAEFVIVYSVIVRRQIAPPTYQWIYVYIFIEFFFDELRSIYYRNWKNENKFYLSEVFQSNNTKPKYW